MSSNFINRELSWLEFNQRVLEESLRDDVPLLERVRFLAISAANLDEFYQVRVGGLMALKRRGSKTTDPSGLTPSRTLAAIRTRVSEMLHDQYQHFQLTLTQALAAHGIRLPRVASLDAQQQGRLTDIFHERIYPLLTPLACQEGEMPPVLPSLQVIIACRLRDTTTRTTRHAMIPLPENLGRLVVLDALPGHCTAVWLEDLVASHAASFFPGEILVAHTCLRVTRNGDIAVEDVDAVDLADEMEEMLSARRFSDTVRLEIQTDAPADLARLARTITGAAASEVQEIHGPLGLSCLFELANLEHFEQLRFEPWPPQSSPSINPGIPMFDTIASGDVMLFHPYESFDPVLRLLEEAAVDPEVIAIKQVLYRTARKSRVIDALLHAAENGKQVTVLVELKARFDEARNLDRADELQRAGAQIVYGVKNLKTHAKICMIVRRESGRLRRYVHIGTGNYNESTARIYTDVSYLTCDPAIGHDASLLFNAVSGRSKLLAFQRLVPAPTRIKQTLLELITGETERARQGLPARIMAKLNSLQDPDIIKALHKAARSGVEIRLNVRGICCLKPAEVRGGRPIQVISIIDRYLEHARIFYFHHGGDPVVHIASADWMTRNLEKRIELMLPVDSEPIKRRLIRILEASFKDNVQASELAPDGRYHRIERRQTKAFRSQQHFHDLARKAAAAHDHEMAMSFEPHVPRKA